jgi:hypothetical protein
VASAERAHWQNLRQTHSPIDVSVLPQKVGRRIKRFGFAIFDSCVLVEEAAADGSQAKNRIVWCVSPPRIWKEKKRKQTHANVILGGEGRVEGVLSS